MHDEMLTGIAEKRPGEARMAGSQGLYGREALSPYANVVPLRRRPATCRARNMPADLPPRALIARALPASVAMTNYTDKLPLPGSMYPRSRDHELGCMAERLAR
jgi:hypothetical protein